MKKDDQYNLPNDYSRCTGGGSDAEGWRDGCEDCLRRTAKSGEWSSYSEPPAIIAFECENIIRPS